MASSTKLIENAYKIAREWYAQWDIDVEQVLQTLDQIPISIHCWQGDDVSGFEYQDSQNSGGIQVTGNYPGKASNPDELRQDLEKVIALNPGTHRVNLHAIYAETNGKKVERNELTPQHFERWIDWAKTHRLGLDFNGTFFRHPLAEDGFTLASQDPSKQKFWIEHGQVCRQIAAYMGKTLGTPCVHNIWIPDGMKDTPYDRKGPRERLMMALDQIFAETIPGEYVKDALESKLFGIGSESYVVGNHEFYLGYASTRQKYLCLDMGHFHPTEQIADKISSLMLFVPGLLFHFSRGVRWDSDHVVILNDELQAVCNELVRNQYLSRCFIGLDFFDASINRIAAWIVGIRSVRRALLNALLEPHPFLYQVEATRNFTQRLLLMEETKHLPSADVWNYYCISRDVPIGKALIQEIQHYEKSVLAKRN